LEEERVIYQKLTIPVETGSALIHLDVMTSPEIINLARCLLKLGKKNAISRSLIKIWTKACIFIVCMAEAEETHTRFWF
jgi:hypothetical protein